MSDLFLATSKAQAKTSKANLNQFVEDGGDEVFCTSLLQRGRLLNEAFRKNHKTVDPTVVQSLKSRTMTSMRNTTMTMLRTTSTTVKEMIWMIWEVGEAEMKVEVSDALRSLLPEL